MPASSARTLLVRALHRSRAPGLLLSAAISCGCGDKERPLPQRPAPTYGIPQQRPTNTVITPPGSSPQAKSILDERASAAARQPRVEQPLQTPEQAAPGEEKKERDYSAELAALLSKSVPGCLTAWKPSTPALTIQITAQVMASGTISRAEAQAPGLTPAIIGCIQKLAGAVQLNGPVADAPRKVQTQLTLQMQGTPNAPQPKAASDDTQEDERDENPRDSRLQQVENDPAEVEQKLYEPTREAPEPPDPKDEPPADNHAD